MRIVEELVRIVEDLVTIVEELVTIVEDLVTAVEGKGLVLEGGRAPTVVFPHDGPQVAKVSLQERIRWLLADVRIVLVGPNGQRDNLAKWLLGRTVLVARARVLYNHLTIRHQLDKAMGIPSVPLELRGDGDGVHKPPEPQMSSDKSAISNYTYPPLNDSKK